MNLLRKHKWHYVNLAIIFALFFLSVQLRKEKLALPLSTEFEWVTAHTLITMQVWEEGGGPAQFNFNPVYTYEGKGNEAVGNLGGVMGKDRRLYYTSYPPFSFIFAYYGTKILGNADVATLRTLGLIMHLFCALLLYLIILKLRSDKKDQISIAGLLGATLYLFSAGTMWMHGIMYFADTCVQLFLLLSVLQLIRLFKGDFQHPIPFYIALGLIIFLGVYTEWLALFFAFFAGLTLLLLYLKQKNRTYINGFLVISFSALMALGTTFFQYSTINGMNALMDVSKEKYLERGGFKEANPGEIEYNWENPESFELIEKNINRNFAMAVNLFGLAFLLLIPVLVWKKLRDKIKPLKWKLLIPLIIALSVLLHYLLFFNFNAIHNISNLKTGFLMILFTATVVLVIEEALSWQLKSVLAALLLIIVIPRTAVEVEKFDGFYSYEAFDQNKSISAQLVREMHDKDKYVFVNTYVTPEYIYKAHHNVFQMKDSADTEKFMDYFNADQAQYFHHHKNKPLFMLELERKNDTIQVVKKITFDSE